MLSLSDQTQMTILSRVPCLGICKEKVSAPTRARGQLRPKTCEEETEVLPVPLPLTDVPRSSGDPSPFYFCKGSWDMVTRGSLNRTSEHFDDGKPWLVIIRWEGQRQNSWRGSSHETSGDGKTDIPPQVPGPKERTPKAKEWLLLPHTHLSAWAPSMAKVGSSLG